MQQLLSDVVALLDAALDGVAVYPTPHVGYIPPAIKLPAVGVHDGPELREELPGEGLEARLSLELACYAHAHSPERGHPALLALAGQVRAALEGRPGLERVEWAACPKGAGTELFSPERGPFVLRKIITITFDMEVS